MKLTNDDIDVLQHLLEAKLEEMEHKEDSHHYKPEIYINIIKKLNTMYFS